MNKRTSLAILALVFGLTSAMADRAAAQTADKQPRVIVGSCTPKVGDDIDVYIHTPQNSDGTIGQIKGVKYGYIAIVQGGKRESGGISGGTRTEIMADADQKTAAAILEAAGYKGKGGGRVNLGKISAISGAFKIQVGDEVKEKSTKQGITEIEVFRSGRSAGTFTVKMD